MTILKKENYTQVLRELTPSSHIVGASCAKLDAAYETLKHVVAGKIIQCVARWSQKEPTIVILDTYPCLGEQSDEED
jgi:hypothetical protein